MNKIKQAETLVCESPEKALDIVKSISAPENLPDSLQARLFTLQTKALLTTGQLVLSDSLIRFSVDYFRNTRDEGRLLEALCLQSRINRSNHYTLLAASQQKEAYALARKLNNLTVQSQIELETGYALHQEGRLIEAKEWLLRGIKNAETTHLPFVQFSAWMESGAIDQTLDKPAQAMESYKKAEALGLKVHTKKGLFHLYEQMTLLCEKTGNYSMALKYNDLARLYRDSRLDIPSLNLKKAVLWSKQYQQDSAYYYAKIAYQSNDSFIAELASSLLSDLERKQGRDVQAWQYMEKYQFNVNAFGDAVEMASIKQKYQQAQLQIENSQLRIKKKEHDFWLLSIVFGVFLLGGGFYIAFLSYKQNQTKLKQRMQEELVFNKSEKLKQENQLLRQEQEISLLREKEALLRESLFRRIHFFDKIPSLQNTDASEESPDRSSRRILLTETDWNELLQNMNEVYPGFTVHLATTYPALDQEDVLFCCLVKINVNLQDLADIYCLSKAAITKRKYRIKKEKLGVADSTLSLDDFLRSL